MEVSGKTLLTTLPMCEPCQTENISQQSDGFCTDCQEYMCQTCFLHHLKAKSCRNHVLDTFNGGSSDRGLQIQETKCRKHTKETIKYYCCSHDSVVCGDCLVSEHPKCEPNFIRDVANNVEESSEFKHLRSMIKKYEVDKTEREMYIERNRKENKTLLGKALQNLQNTRKDVNVWLDKMEKNIEIEARKISEDNEELLSEVEKNLNTAIDDIDKIKEKIDTKIYQREILFINTVECKPKIIAIEATLSDIKTSNAIRTYAFEPEIKVNETSALSLRLGVIKISSDVYKEETQTSSQDDSNDSNIFSDALIMRAMFNYDAINDGDISFRKGDKLEVLEKESQNLDWSVARHLTTGEKGYIPSNYVVQDDTSVQSQDWWHNVDRTEANRHLLLPGNPFGTFLVRPGGENALYKLSVLHLDREIGDARVAHYRIQHTDDVGFYVNIMQPFNNMLDLIFHYKAADGLCCKLEIACPKVRPFVLSRELEVARDSVKLLKKLGSGFFGEVFAGKWRNTVDVAVKVLKPGQLTANDFLSEAKVVHQLRHNKLVQLMAVCTKSETVWIITECFNNGTLLNYLRQDDGHRLRFPDLQDMACQIADGMAYLEIKNFVHRNLRAANILLGNHNDVKIADFYGARTNTKFPIRWISPEAAFDRKFSIKSDVWSYGVLLYELITFGRVPYSEIKSNQLLNKIHRGYRMPKPLGGPVPCPEPYYEIILKCWNRVADSRPTFSYLHDFFDFYEVAAKEKV